jgi:tRNA modification GTPase
LTSAADTIAAIATPPGQGGVAIVRVSGGCACAIVERLFRSASGRGLTEPRRVYLGHLLERPGGAPIDRVLVFAMPGPHSYTGEDVVEIQCHGGSVVSRRVLESVLASGARPAAPGEFTKRAFLNGRIDLAQAEAVADMIAARSDTALRLARSQLEGYLSVRIRALRGALLQARALCEAAIDFPEEDVPEMGDGRMAGELVRVRVEIERLLAGFERARIRYEGARAVLVGKTNVGKSSLLNALAGRERAIVTPVAGTTRDVVEAAITLGDAPVVVADTAGIRDTDDAVERLGVERTRAAIADAACVVAIFDRSEPLDASDRLVVAAVAGRPVVTVLNKCDLPARAAAPEVGVLTGDAPPVEVSAVTGIGIAALVAALEQRLLAPGDDGAEDEIAIFRVRHRDAAKRAAADLARAEAALAHLAPAELIASDLSAAAGALAMITGEVTAEDVLDRVFAEFCIGK